MSEIELEIDDNTPEIDLEIEVTSGGTDDYRKLNNLPSINGVPLIDNYDEQDPTVPEWAKQENPPTYTAEDVGAMPADTFIPTYLADMGSDEEHRTVTDQQISTWDSKSDFDGDYNSLKNKPTIPEVEDMSYADTMAILTEV